MQEGRVLPSTTGSHNDAHQDPPSSLVDCFSQDPVMIVESPEGEFEDAWIRESERTIRDTERILSKPTDNSVAETDLAGGHFPNGLTPGLTTVREAEYHDEDSEIDSNLSGDASGLSALTESSFPTNIFEVASIALVRFLATDDTLKPLCVAAASTISAEVFQRKYLLLLRKYGCDLRSEARTHVEKQAANFIRKRACDAARAIRRHFFETAETLLHELLRYPSKDAAVVEDFLSGIDEEYCSSEDSASDGEPSEALPEQLDSIKEFLLHSEALRLLRHDLELFLTPPEEHLTKRNTAEQLDNTGMSTITGEQAQAGERAPEDHFQSGILYLARTRSFPVHFLSFGFYHTVFLRCYIFCLTYMMFCLTYMLSLVSQADLEKYSRDQSAFKLIYIYDVNGNAQESTVRLDTGSDLNVISAKKLTQLGRNFPVARADHGVRMKSVDGHTYEPLCSVELRWSLRKNTRIHKERFFVVDDCPEELLFSNLYIEKLGIIRYYWERTANMSFNVFDKKYVETAADREAEKRRRDEKLALEAKKKLAAVKQEPLATIGTSQTTPEPTSNSSSTTGSSKS